MSSQMKEMGRGLGSYEIHQQSTELQAGVHKPNTTYTSGSSNSRSSGAMESLPCKLYIESHPFILY